MVLLYGQALFLGSIAFLAMHLLLIFADCLLDLSGANFALAPSICSSEADSEKCCRHINAFTAVSVARYVNSTGNLRLPLNQSDACLSSSSQTMGLYGVPFSQIYSEGIKSLIVGLLKELGL